MTPANLDITIYQGATWRLPMQWVVNNVPVDLTGYTLRAQAKLTFNSNDQRTLFDLTAVITDAVNGMFEISLTSEETAAFDFIRGSWELEAVQPNADILRILQGYVSLSRGVEP